MFHAYSFDIKDKLVAGSNNIVVRYLPSSFSLSPPSLIRLIAFAFAFAFRFSLFATRSNACKRIKSAAKYAKKSAEESAKKGKVYPLWEYPQGEPHRNHIRKCGCHFGWDWGPCFVPCGVSLIGSFALSLYVDSTADNRTN